MRSKTFLVSNILATLYSIGLLWIFVGAIIKAGGSDFVEAMGSYFEFVFDSFDVSGNVIRILYTVVILLCVHIAMFNLGCFIGWIAFAAKKSGGAKFAATLYLIGTICFPICILFGLPVTIIGYVGGSKQKKLNLAALTD